MKRAFTLLLALCLLGGAAATATEITQDSEKQSATMTISTVVSAGYTVVIPPRLDIGFNALSTDLPVTVNDLRLNPGKALTVSSTSKGNLRNGTNELPFTVENAAGSGSTLTFTQSGTQSLKVRISQQAWNAAPGGQYTGSATFTITQTTRAD